MQPSARFMPRWLVKPLSFIVPILVIIGIVAAIVVWRQPDGETSTGETWTCSMHPQVRQSRPGQCPICGMNLIPLSQLAAKEKTEKRAGIETEPVAYRELFKEIHTVGKLDYNESQIAEITARVAGRVDRLYADFTGIKVGPGDHLVDIYSPELFVAQEELQRSLDAARRSPNDGFSTTNLESARMKLRLLGLLPEQIAEMEQSAPAADAPHDLCSHRRHRNREEHSRRSVRQRGGHAVPHCQLRPHLAVPGRI